MRTTIRTNYQWISDLQQTGPTHLQAVRDLREFLERGLYHYLSDKRNDLADFSGVALRQIAQKIARESLHKVLDNLALFQGASQFTTWAAKFAARAATTDLKCSHSIQLKAQPPDLVEDDMFPALSNALRIRRNELALRIADWEDDGGRVLAE